MKDELSFVRKHVSFPFWTEIKDDLPKKGTLKYDIFSMIIKGDISFPCKYDMKY